MIEPQEAQAATDPTAAATQAAGEAAAEFTTAFGGLDYDHAFLIFIVAVLVIFKMGGWMYQWRNSGDRRSNNLETKMDDLRRDIFTAMSESKKESDDKFAELNRRIDAVLQKR